MAEAATRGLFDLTGRVAVITGGAGLLGRKHAETIADLGGFPILLDVDGDACNAAVETLRSRYDISPLAIVCDVTNDADVKEAQRIIMARLGRVDVLVNNAANNPKVEETSDIWSRVENFPLSVWERDLAVGLKGAFLCARAFGKIMADAGKGSIINIGSDLGLIAPDQRLYEVQGARKEDQPVKPVTYSVVKAGLIGLTRYLATYWAKEGVRVNYLAPGGIENGQEKAFVEQLVKRIPLGRMARKDEYMGAIAFLASDASSYMTGSTMVLDGGRTTW